MGRLAQGDETAFCNLWWHYRSYLHIGCTRWLGSNRFEDPRCPEPGEH